MDMMRRRFLALGGMGLVAACTGKPPPEPSIEVPLITFTHLPAIRLDVATIDVQQPFISPGRPPNVDHLQRNPPVRVAERWAHDRLRAAGPEGLARFTILDASIIETSLKTDKGVQGIFKSQVDTRYDGRIEIRLDVKNAGGTGFAKAAVTRSQTAREDMTLNERDALMVQFVEDMGRDLNERLEAEITRTLTRFVI